MTKADTTLNAIVRGGDGCPILHDVQSVIDVLRDIRIWADLENELALRAINLPIDIRHVRYFDAADGKMIASLSDHGETVLTAFDIADVVTWHVDHRLKRLVSSQIKRLDADALELWIEFVHEPSD